MVQYTSDQIIRFRKSLRKNLLGQIFDHFGQNMMDLPDEKRAVKYRRMKENTFRYYRGSAFWFYEKVSQFPFPYHTPEDKPTWIQGDLHFENFGGFQNENGEIVFDVNDFDEGYLGSYLYDILRMAVSIALVCKLNDYNDWQTREAIRSYIHAYYKQMERFAKGEHNPVTLTFDEERTKGAVKKVIRKLKERDRSDLLDRFTTLDTDHKRRYFKRNEELQDLTEYETEKLHQAWPEYLNTLQPDSRKADDHYRIQDVVVKHGSGTASIGLDRFYVLIEGGAAKHDDIILEVKEVRAPVPAYFLPYYDDFWNAFPHQGKRVIATQKAMHHASDPYLGYLTIDGRHFYVRERSPYKKKIKYAKLTEFNKMVKTLQQMGKITAKIHARADTDTQDRLFDYHSDVEILKAMGPDEEAFSGVISEWALNFRMQVERDYELFCEWVDERFG